MTNESPTKPSLFKQQPLTVIALALAIIAIVFAALAWQQYSAVRDDIGDRTTHLQQAFLQLKTDTQIYQSQTQATIAANEKNISAVMNQLNGDKAQPTLVEATYLIHLADLKLRLENNTTQAITLLKMVAQRLQPLTTPSIQPLKEAVTHDIATLSAIPPINVNDLINQIDHLGEQISQLNMPAPAVTPTSTTHTDGVTTGSWWDKIKNNLSGLKDLFIVRHMEEPMTTPINPKQFSLIQESIRLKLSQAQWALLYGQKNIYQQSLHTAAQWLMQLNQNQANINTLAKDLESLAVIDIKPQLPALQSLPLLQPTAEGVSK